MGDKPLDICSVIIIPNQIHFLPILSPITQYNQLVVFVNCNLFSSCEVTINM